GATSRDARHPPSRADEAEVKGRHDGRGIVADAARRTAPLARRVRPQAEPATGPRDEKWQGFRGDHGPVVRDGGAARVAAHGDGAGPRIAGASASAGGAGAAAAALRDRLRTPAALRSWRRAATPAPPRHRG